MCEIGARIDELRLRNGIHEVRAGHSPHCSLNGIVIEEIAENDLDSFVAQSLRTVVVVMNEGPDLRSLRQQVVDGTPARGARCACYQIQFIAHFSLQIRLYNVRNPTYMKRSPVPIFFASRTLLI